MGTVLELRLRVSNDWTSLERIQLQALVERLSTRTARDVAYGVTDAGDPWCAILDANGEVLLHIARIEGRFLVHAAHEDVVSEARDLWSAVTRFAGGEPPGPRQATIVSLGDRLPAHVFAAFAANESDPQGAAETAMTQAHASADHQEPAPLQAQNPTSAPQEEHTGGDLAAAGAMVSATAPSDALADETSRPVSGGLRALQVHADPAPPAGTALSDPAPLPAMGEQRQDPVATPDRLAGEDGAAHHTPAPGPSAPPSPIGDAEGAGRSAVAQGGADSVHPLDVHPPGVHPFEVVIAGPDGSASPETPGAGAKDAFLVASWAPPANTGGFGVVVEFVGADSGPANASPNFQVKVVTTHPVTAAAAPVLDHSDNPPPDDHAAVALASAPVADHLPTGAEQTLPAGPTVGVFHGETPVLLASDLWTQPPLQLMNTGHEVEPIPPQPPLHLDDLIANPVEYLL